MTRCAAIRAGTTSSSWSPPAVAGGRRWTTSSPPDAHRPFVQALSRACVGACARPINRVMASLRHDDSGFSLIEVLVSAMLVALIAVGVLSMFDSASATSGRERARTQAASLANREIARYKAMSPVNLMALAGTTQTRSITLAKQAYNLSTTIDWAPDQTGDDVVCTGQGPPQYLKLVTTASTPAGGA